MAAKPVQNFGGKNNELWCEGGEEAFVRKMVEESVGKANNCLWFTSLISKNTTLPAIYHALNVAGAAEVRTIEMAQGQRSAASSPGPSTTPSNRPPGSRTLALTLPAPVILTAPTKSAFYLSIFITYVILNTGLIIKILGYWFI